MWSKYVIIPNFMAINQTVTELWRFKFFFFKMAAVRYLGFFFKFDLLNRDYAYTSKGLCALSCKIVLRSIKPFLSYSNLTVFFQNGGHTPSWIFKDWNL